MILNRQQKENMVIDLLNQGISVPQIAKQAHVSFSDIKKIRMKLTGEVSEVQQEEDPKRKNQSAKFFLVLIFLKALLTSP
jgi:hypothetical protein